MRKSIFILLLLVLSMPALFAQAPGGVADGLKMWLRADDASKLTLAPNTVIPNYTNSFSIAWQGLGTPSTTQTVVDRWTSSVGSTFYSSNTSYADIRKPVYLQRHYLMNYHPTVDFYTNWETNSSKFSTFLTTANAPMSVGRPASSTTITVMNSAVKDGYSGDRQNLYFISWHPNATLSDYGDYKPGFGLRNNAGDGQPRFRVNSSVDITTKAFSAGQTTIVDYQITNIGVSSSNRIDAGAIQAGYNMNFVSNSSRVTADEWYMNKNGSLGGSRYNDRSLKGMISEVIQYERALTIDERKAVSSYFAIKYGITLRPSNVSPKRFDYVLSNGTIFWAGNSGAGTSQWVKFYNNIAAVIRDDASHLNNVQSHSTDIGSMVHLGAANSTMSELYFDGSPAKLGSLAYDEEVIAFGNDIDAGANAAKGVLNVNQECGDFNYIFNRRWLVNKITNGNRPIQMVVAAQNNIGNNLGYGVSPQELEMYSSLVASNDVFLIVADSPDKFNPTNAGYGDFKAVIPMRFINGEHQCIYTFTEKETYFTFGYKSNTRGCPSDVKFNGAKVLDWSQWTRQFVGRTFYDSINSNTEKSSSIFNLGDSITAQQTIMYEASVRANNSSPRYVTRPKGSIELMRRYGTVGITKVTATIEYSTPVLPEFFISGLDERSRKYDEVTVTGYCANTPYAPELSYAGDPKTSSYKINNNTATVYKRGSQNANSKNGTVNVEFQGGVSKVVIEYVIKNRIKGSSVQRIYISPITVRQVPPPSPVTDGLSFVQDVKDNNISICEPVEYTFYIENTNTENKYIKFTDVLPAGMKWEHLALDSINAGEAKINGIDISNHFIKINDFEKKDVLEIDSLYIPCTSRTKIIAVASLNDDAVTQAEVSRQFASRATIFYNKVEKQPATAAVMESLDRMTLNDSTVFTATWAEHKDTITINATATPEKFNANQEVEVTLKIINNNEPIANTYLDMDWDADFTYVSGSYHTLVNNSPAALGAVVTANVEPDEPLLTIAGNHAGEIGFTLPVGETVFKFKLRAPVGTDLEHEYDENGVEIPDKYIPLTVNYLFSSEEEDVCILESMHKLLGEIIIPHKKIKHIIINKHNTVKMKR